MNQAVIPIEMIESRVLVLRGHKVMLAPDLAELYEIDTKVLNQAVSRNKERFPEDFMFQMNKEEFEFWRSHFVTSNSANKMGLRYAPYAFTEHGILMLSSVLRSNRAVQVNIEIMRTFVKMREMILSHKELALRIDALESRYDNQFKSIFDALRELMTPVENQNSNPIGFQVKG